MNEIFIVASKEINQIVKSRNVLISAFVFSLVFGGMAAPSAAGGEGSALLDQLGFSLVLMLGILMGYVLSGQAFLREKQAGIIETLLCSPLSLRQIWMGKVIGVTLPAYGMTLIAAGMIIGIANALSPAVLLPSAPVIFHIVMVVPVLIASAVGMLGFGQLLLGMRENQILNVAIIFLIVFLITLTQGILGPGVTITWSLVGAVLGIALLLLLVTQTLTRFLDTERIVRTIP
jgi:ABC-2 type transport system permease protein